MTITLFPLRQWLASLLCVVLVRCLIESLSSPNGSGGPAVDVATVVHYGLFFVTLIMGLCLAVSAVTGLDLERLTALAPYGAAATWIAPTVDLLVVHKGRMTYLAGGPHELLRQFVTFFGPTGTQGAPPASRSKSRASSARR